MPQPATGPGRPARRRWETCLWISASCGVPSSVYRRPTRLEAAMQHPESGEAAETAAGTEDLLLFVDMIHVPAQGCARNDATGGGNLPANAAALGQRLKQVHWSEQSDGICSKADGQLLFDENGNRRSSSGE